MKYLKQLKILLKVQQDFTTSKEAKKFRIISQLLPVVRLRVIVKCFSDENGAENQTETLKSSCLVKHLEDQNTCPDCNLVIHQSHPLQYISHDRTMQDIVYKLVPNLQENELNREREFYKSRNMTCPKDIPQDTKEADEMESKLNEAHQESDYHRMDEQVNLCLECSASSNLKNLKRRFIRCSSQATITQLKKFVAKKVLNGIDKYREIDILCNDELLGKDHTLKFVYVTRWRFKDPPLRLQYRPKILDL
ncbi:CLUMA_CG010599, isoform A [Clunio marinus]|uniref:CLUMA_CG010599, isoform A n=1 Tax=Clunio marinus TaxID=568069 RepID=A0A1J1IBS9_9DIPT|nr:CLUMA_CG010599, isoform A [Clunio marinus]